MGHDFWYHGIMTDYITESLNIKIWGRYTSTAMTMAGPGIMVQWGVRGGRMMMDVCRAMALATSMIDLARAMWIFTLKMDQWLMSVTALK
jgi:hypothetical protein